MNQEPLKSAYSLTHHCNTLLSSVVFSSCFLIIFASSAGMRTLVDQDLEKVSSSDRQYIVDESRRSLSLCNGQNARASMGGQGCGGVYHRD